MVTASSSICNKYMIHDVHGINVFGDNRYLITAETVICRHIKQDLQSVIMQDAKLPTEFFSALLSVLKSDNNKL
jgi:hypothetical protein